MNTKTLWQNWHFIRVLKLVLGLAVLIHAIDTKDILPGILGGVLLLMAVFNTGCGGGIACAVNRAGKTNIKYAEEAE